MPNATTNLPYNHTLTQTGLIGTPIWSIVTGALPLGLTLNTITGIISGVPTVFSGTANFAIRVTGSDNNCFLSFLPMSITTCPIITFTNTIANDVVVGAIFAPIEVSVTLNGASGINYAVAYSVTPALPATLQLSNNGTSAFISGYSYIAIPSATYTVTATYQGCSKTQTYTFGFGCPNFAFSNTTIPPSTLGVYYAQSSGVVVGAIGNFIFSISPSLPSGLILDSAFGTIRGYPQILAPTSSYTITCFSVNCNTTISQNYTFGVICPTVTINTLSLPNGTFQGGYGQSLSQTGLNAPNWSISTGSLPPGLTIRTYDGLISGYPSTTGTYNFTALVEDRGCSQTKTYTIIVTCPSIITIDSTNLSSNAFAGIFYLGSLSSTPMGVGNWSVIYGALPPGIILQAPGTSSVVLSGQPTALGTYNFTIQIENGGCTGTKSCTIVVSCPIITINTLSLSNGVVQSLYQQSITQTGLISPSWSVIAGSLPPGLVLNAGGAFNSTYPWTAGIFNFTIQALSAYGCSQTRNYTIVISCPTITIDPISLPNGIMWSGYNQLLSATGLYAGNWSVSSGSLPPGLTLSPSMGTSSNGRISGIPSTVGTYNFTIQIASGGCSQTRAYTIIITPNGNRINATPDVVYVFPNPSSGDFNIDFTTLNIAGATMSLYNSQGRRVLSANIDNSQMLISLVNEPAGLYLLEITNASGKIVKRLIKE